MTNKVDVWYTEVDSGARQAWPVMAYRHRSTHPGESYVSEMLSHYWKEWDEERFPDPYNSAEFADTKEIVINGKLFGDGGGTVVTAPDHDAALPLWHAQIMEICGLDLDEAQGWNPEELEEVPIL